jgi:hypothetical protein
VYPSQILGTLAIRKNQAWSLKRWGRGRGGRDLHTMLDQGCLLSVWRWTWASTDGPGPARCNRTSALRSLCRRPMPVQLRRRGPARARVTRKVARDHLANPVLVYSKMIPASDACRRPRIQGAALAELPGAAIAPQARQEETPPVSVPATRSPHTRRRSRTAPENSAGRLEDTWPHRLLQTIAGSLPRPDTRATPTERPWIASSGGCAPASPEATLPLRRR